jgi:hypothetical protein
MEQRPVKLAFNYCIDEGFQPLREENSQGGGKKWGIVQNVVVHVFTLSIFSPLYKDTSCSKGDKVAIPFLPGAFYGIRTEKDCIDSVLGTEYLFVSCPADHSDG